MRLVVVESPYAGDIDVNVAYARACVRDCLERGEAPIASHLLYPQVLDDADPQQSQLGIDAGLAWGARADIVAFHVDRGWSPGMRAAREHWERVGVAIEVRRLSGVAVGGPGPASSP